MDGGSAKPTMTVTNVFGQANYVVPPCSLLAAPPGLYASMQSVLDEPD